MLGTLSVFTATLADSAALLFDGTDRRLRSVERDPRIATALDIELLVRAHGVPESKVWSVIDRIEAADLAPSLVWAWTMQYDGIELADLLGSALTDGEVVAHLESRTSVARGLMAA